MIVDLQQRGFDGIVNEAVKSAIPGFAFDPKTIDIHIMKYPGTRAAGIRHETELARYHGCRWEIGRQPAAGGCAIGDRMHNRLLSVGQTKLIPGISYRRSRNWKMDVDRLTEPQTLPGFTRTTLPGIRPCQSLMPLRRAVTG